MKKIIEINDVNPLILSGPNDENIKLIESNFKSLIVLRGNTIYTLAWIQRGNQPPLVSVPCTGAPIGPRAGYQPQKDCLSLDRGGGGYARCVKWKRIAHER